MAEDQAQESMTAGANVIDAEIDALRVEREALKKKNYELIGKLQKKELINEMPDDYNELKEFKRQAEQNKLESEGKYTEARQALEQQYREATAEKDKRIAELEARVRELELIAPANTALADVVHDPSIVFKAGLLNSNQIEREADGTVVVVNGYERKPIGDWAKTLPSYMQKAPKPQGSGAPSGRSASGDIPAGTKNPFAPESFDLTEQMRLYRTNMDMYERLKAAANR
ncbi:phage minor structural protein GP20 [uncultured Mediterranean phage uvMED]|nr:phage minor structural protein GP20 [uncultured Mediterranean phage uvMED]BAQ93601.1 phage minor structural protein GP20 [uncultured Mediterranean phage uvMED]BAR24995.1 phage minor structural protein GP20 [uncultured Mediterranean phage uvMED]BAR25050.1 phage minor structural protein GP20 [uncultured Mediterranean phage uvMED]BAR25089.1 phage minor structural protein GP20 [uncultured Mediterranean phage uvMED]